MDMHVPFTFSLLHLLSKSFVAAPAVRTWEGAIAPPAKASTRAPWRSVYDDAHRCLDLNGQMQ